MMRIRKGPIFSRTITVPGSKSYTHRALIAAALSEGRTVIRNALQSEDTQYTKDSLRQMGVPIEDSGKGLIVEGCSGSLKPAETKIFVGNSGTSMRLLTGVAALVRGQVLLYGTRRMHERPIQDLIDGLNQAGVKALCINADGCPPVEINGQGLRGGSIALNCSISSQFLSALLLVAPFARHTTEIRVTQGPVSRPYVDLTLDIMQARGVAVDRQGYSCFTIAGGQAYAPGIIDVEPDCSQASYFWAAAAISGKTIKVRGVTRKTRQGDVGIVDVFAAMGCSVKSDADGIAVTGAPLRGIEVDMGDMPDMVPTLAVVAAFAGGQTIIKNVAQLKAKECDRLEAVATELRKMGAIVTTSETAMVISAPATHGAEIDTYDDHRIAMSFAVAGLKIPGMHILNERCVEKSFPHFWDVFETLKHPET